MRRRTGTRIASAVVTVTLTAFGSAALTGCGAVEKALDCADTAVTVANSVEDLQQVVSEGAENPAEAAQALNRIDGNLDRIADKTDNADVSQAVEEMRQAVDSAQSAVNEGRTPEIGPIGDAADELTQVCSPG